MTKKAAIAILVCAVMVMVVGAPFALATHDVTRGAQGPRASAVTWEYQPASSGVWTGLVVNNGLRSLAVDVYDNTTGALEEVMHQRIRFSTYDAYPIGTVETAGVVMAFNHRYSITVTPNGPKGSSCTVDDVFVGHPPIAMITVVSVDYLTVVVDGSSSDPYGTMVSYAWDFGDGSSATGVTATHTYSMAGTYTITLTVTDNYGSSSSASELVTAVEPPPPTASFTVTASGLTVDVDASASTGYGSLSYTWDWGDGTIGAGRTASHTYSLNGAIPAGSELTTLGRSRPPPPYAVFGFTYAADGVTALPGCYVTVTQVRTGDTLIWDETRADWDPNANVYSVDITEFRAGYRIGDMLNVTAIEGTSIGWTEAPITGNSNGYDQIDVTLHPREPIVVTITLTVTDTVGQTDTVNHSVELVPLPIASFTYSVNAQDVNVNASGSSAWFGIVSYVWSWGDGTTGTGKVASHTFPVPQSPSDPATKTISLTVTDALGQIDSANQSVHVLYRPMASFSVSPISGNLTTTFTFDASSSSDFETLSSELQIRWDWENDGVADTVWSTEKQIRHQFVLHGTYGVRLEVLDTDGYIGTTIKDVAVFFSARGWMTETVDSAGEVGRSSSIAIDSNNEAHISYWDALNYDLKYATNVGGLWAYYTIDSGYVGEDTSIAIDSRDKVHISYLDYPNGDLKYATNAGGSWVCYTLDTNGYAGHDSSIAIDSNDKVHICYKESWERSLMYATNAGGSWAYYTVDSLGDVGWYASLALDSNNNAHISYCEFVASQHATLKYATNAGGSWLCSTLDSQGSVGYNSCITVDSNDAVHISYTDRGGGDANLKYATNAGGSWANYTLDSVGTVGYYSSIAVDSDNAVHISYLDWSNADLKYASNAGGSWACYTLDYNRGYGNGQQPTSIAIDSNNIVHISYSDGVDNDLKHAVVS